VSQLPVYPQHLADAAAQNNAARTNAMKHTSAESATVLPSAASSADPSLGAHGGVTLKPLRTNGRVYPAGVLLSAQLVMSFRPANRAALVANGTLLLFERELPPEVLAKLKARDAEITRAELS
jgi:hypothetical protein